jgi:putative hydrolase of the HAD superfamily
MLKAIILDLDNTIYPVKSIADQVFAPLFELIERDEKHKNDLKKIKYEIMRRPFHLVANEYRFSEELKLEALNLLKNTTYSGKMFPFEDYSVVRDLAIDKYLVTTGFLELQRSKISRLKIENDFKEIHIVDPSTSDKTKKEVFTDIVKRNNYAIGEVVVVGDDLHSEIKAAQELGIEAVLYDRDNLYPLLPDIKRINNFRELIELIK